MKSLAWRHTLEGRRQSEGAVGIHREGMEDQSSEGGREGTAPWGVRAASCDHQEAGDASGMGRLRERGGRKRDDV